MTTATLSSPSVTQLTFPWATASDDEGVIVADRQPVSAPILAPVDKNEAAKNEAPVVAKITAPDVASSLSDALVGDRIGRPFRMGNVMFRLLKSYGITDEEIAAGVAAYNAKRASIKLA